MSRKKVLKRRQRGGTNPVNVCVREKDGSYTAEIGPCHPYTGGVPPTGTELVQFMDDNIADPKVAVATQQENTEALAAAAVGTAAAEAKAPEAKAPEAKAAGTDGEDVVPGLTSTVAETKRGMTPPLS